MTHLKEPPTTRGPDSWWDGEEEFGLDGGKDGWRRVAGFSPSKLKVRSAINRMDLIAHTGLSPGSDSLDLVDAMRGLRAITRGRGVYRKGNYAPMEGDQDNEWFICSLAPGTYHVEYDHDGYPVLMWQDNVGTRRASKPKLEAEIAHLTPPEIELPAPKPQSLPRKPISPPPEEPCEPGPQAEPGPSLKRKPIALQRRPISLRRASICR
jgi:hypothetical protein